MIAFRSPSTAAQFAFCFTSCDLLRVASGPRVKLASCKSALTPAPRPPARHRWFILLTVLREVVQMLVLLFVALWFTLRGDLFYVLPCVILFLCFSVLLALRLLRMGKRELILVLFVRLFELRLFGFVCFLFLLVSGKGCGMWLWHSLDFSLTFFVIVVLPGLFSYLLFNDYIFNLHNCLKNICKWNTTEHSTKSTTMKYCPGPVSNKAANSMGSQPSP